MNTQRNNPILNFVLMFVLAFSWLGVTPAAAGRLPESSASSSLSVESWLNPDGTLNLRPGTSGKLDLAGWNVTLDAERGPVFALAVSTAGRWSELDGGTTGVVWTVAISGTDVIVGGNFTGVGACTSDCKNIARWNGTTWSALGTGTSGIVWTLAISGTDVIAGGAFTSMGACSGCKYIAKWNGTTWSALDTGTTNTVYAIAISGTDVIAGGIFTSAGACTSGCSHIAKWNGTAWSALGTGTTNTVYAITISGTDVIVGGSFTQAGNCDSLAGCNYIAKWNGTTWSALGKGANNYVRVLAIRGADLIAGGIFTSMENCTSDCKNIARWDGTTWSALGAGTNGGVYALAIIDTDLIAGGAFTSAGTTCTSACAHIARWNGTTWSALDTGTTDAVYTLAIRGTDVIAGGQFTSAGACNSGCNRIARYVFDPALTGIAPNSGPISGGTSVVLTGSHLTGSSVTFGGITATCTVNSDTQITCASPAHAAGAVNVAVTTPGGTATVTAGFTYVALINILPNSGPASGGTSVVLTVTGTHLSGGSATFGGTVATCTLNSPIQITCTTPAHAAGAVDVAVPTLSGTVTAVGGFTYIAAPTLTNIVPNSGPISGGTSVILTGANLTGGSVTFGGSAATCTVNSATQITCTTPAHAAGVVDVAVTTPGGTVTTTAGFTYYYRSLLPLLKK
jgi:hypothetical protein